MNEARGCKIFCYFNDTVCIVFVSMCLTKGDGQPFSLDNDVRVFLLSGQIVTLLWGECVWHGDSVLGEQQVASLQCLTEEGKKSFSCSRNWEMKALSCQLLVPVISQMNPDHTLWTFIFNIDINPHVCNLFQEVSFLHIFCQHSLCISSFP
jgi:hypothetical protein